jgi:hypothetical protein
VRGRKLKSSVLRASVATLWWSTSGTRYDSLRRRSQGVAHGSNERWFIDLQREKRRNADPGFGGAAQSNRELTSDSRRHAKPEVKAVGQKYLLNIRHRYALPDSLAAAYWSQTQTLQEVTEIFLGDSKCRCNRPAVKRANKSSW